MKKPAFFLLAILALAGILNCFVIEPAFANKDAVMHIESTDETDCCLIHCSMCQQWVVSAHLMFIHDVRLLDTSALESILSDPDSPPVSIFHPPLAF